MTNDDHALRRAHEQASGRVWASCVDMKDVGSFEEFMETWPMYWMPRKVEVARILAIGKQMQAARGTGGPLRILEVGGANAALADLLVGLAEENGLDVAYTIVDPEAETMTEAAMAHVGDRRFSFHAETVEHFVAKRGRGDSEDVLMEESPAYDLVINAWMPPEMDFTKDVRAANGAAIVYVIETWGGTGSKESYDGGRMYRTVAGWVGHSLPELQRQDGRVIEGERRAEFCNAVLIQYRRDIDGGGLLPDLERAGIDMGEPYPWEAELTKRQGDVAPVIPLGDREYHDDLMDLVERMLEQRKEKR